jgi:glycosyltransferase involved in cell wall biosynthesis
MDKLKILVSPANDGGCSFYRAWDPYQKLAQLYPDQVEIRFDKNPLNLNEENGKLGEEEDLHNLKWCDIVVTQNIANYGGPYTARLCGISKKFGKFFHYDTDDLLIDLYDGHRLKKVYEEQNLYDITKFIYSHADLVTVTQKKFAERVKPYCGGVLAIVKNAIDYTLPGWNVPKEEIPNKNLVRIGWAGGIHHEEDVKEFAGVPHFINQRVGAHRVSWDFYGAPPLEPGQARDWQHDVWDNYKRILLRGFKGTNNWNIFNALGPRDYGVMFSRMELAIAPLQMNDFNDSKSEIKVAECGKYQIPLIASNVGCYDETIVNGQTGYLIDPEAPPKEWVRVLLKVINNKKHREEMGRNLKAITDEYFDLNKVVKHRLDLYRECFRLQTVNLKAGLAEVIQGKAVGDLVKRISDKNDTNL